MGNYKNAPSSYARILFRYLGLTEANSQAYFVGTTVSYRELMTLDGTISSDDMATIYRNALAISGRDDLGLLVGSQLNLPTHGPLGVAAFSGPDLETAVTLLANFGQIRANFFHTSVSDHATGLKINFCETFDLGDLRLFITEAVLSGLFSAIAFFIGAHQFKGQVYFSYAKPKHWRKYHRAFGDNIQFNHTVTEIIISSSLLSTPSPAADAALHQEAMAICEQQMRAFTADQTTDSGLSLKQKVSTLIIENPGRIWTLREVAEKLCMSSRTLIRKLHLEGTTFQIIRDELAKKQVVTYLKDANLTVESVGHLMGFSDVSSFRRSFKRWFEETPSEYIARNRPAKAPMGNSIGV